MKRAKCFAIACLMLIGLLSPSNLFAHPSLDSLKDWLANPRDQRPDLKTESFAAAKLTKDQAATARQLLWDDHAAEIKETRAKEWNDKAITIGQHTLKLLVK